VRVQLVPVPEGTATAAFADQATPPERPLSQIRRFIPTSLPQPISQTCTTGEALVFTLSDRTQITYGPCRYPSSIVHLWAEIQVVLTKGACRPRCGPEGRRGP